MWLTRNSWQTADGTNNKFNKTILSKLGLSAQIIAVIPILAIM